QGEISSTTIYSPVIIPGSPTNIGNESSLKLRSRKLLQDLGVLDKYSPEELNQLKGKVAVDISAII
ncbi:MAG: hypothetical protein KTR14_07130, partial [Vampirovibrio sp.]|nr:hypothetical protein [Vampirovibrio sp.]